jgi:hypothetical protein
VLLFPVLVLGGCASERLRVNGQPSEGAVEDTNYEKSLVGLTQGLISTRGARRAEPSASRSST